MTAQPTVGVAFVTRPSAERMPHINQSLADLANQSYPVHELVVVLDARSEERAKKSLRNTLSRPLVNAPVRLIEPPVCTLGALRNISRDQATADFVCQWDDDDRHHPSRIERQLHHALATGGVASLLQENFQLFQSTGELFWTNWKNSEAACHEGTILCKREVPVRYPESGEFANTKEDHAFKTELQNTFPIALVGGEPHLFVYMSHGANLMPNSHHRMLARELGLSAGLLKRRRPLIENHLKSFGFSRDIIVTGPKGSAFKIPYSHSSLCK